LKSDIKDQEEEEEGVDILEEQNEEMEDDLLDSEFPPDNFSVVSGDEDDMLDEDEISGVDLNTASLPPVISHAPIPPITHTITTSLHPVVPPIATQVPIKKSTIVSPLNPPLQNMTLGSQEYTIAESLVSKHRQHLKDLSELARIEGKLLVDFTMKLDGEAPNTSIATGGNVPFDIREHAKELDNILKRKMDAISEFRISVKKMMHEH
jgi:hypothetical protein